MRVLTASITDDPGQFSDVEMASPTDSSPVQGELVDGNESETAIEIDSNTFAANSESVTTRTIRKFRSLRRPSATPIDQQRPPAPEILAQDGTPLTSKGPQGSTSPAATSASGPVPISSTKPKIMKRAKTIVFRPEVTMQPLSSKNVIPPWNRIPSTMAPISPVSPTSPSLPPSNDGSGDPLFDSPLSSCNEERPRKLSMTQSKTMSSIPTQPALFSLAYGSSGGASSTESSSASAATSPSGLVATSGFGASITRGGSVSSQGSLLQSTTPLVAPWNRVDSKSEINTHLHSLIKIAGQPSPSLQSPAVNSPFVPVEISKSVKKKHLQAVPTAPKGLSGRGLSKSVTVPANLKDYQNQNPEFSQQIQTLRSNPVPVLTQPPQPRSRTSSNSRVRNGSGMTMTRSRSAADTSLARGVVPIMTISAPEPWRPQQGVEQDNAVPSDGIRKKRVPRRESGSLHSPSMSTKQPVSILKNSGTRKSSLTVPASSVFSPSQIRDNHQIVIKPRSSSITVATTFKIVMDADTIVALQVVEDPREFVLTLAELRTRIEAKLLKSNIQLPAAFDLVWKSSALASVASIASAPESLPTSAIPLTSTSSIFPGQGLVLKNDQDLLQAIQGSKNRKVTLRCTV
ncbi:hypothetical protein BGZ93_001592 [Podila epicladia]|nr:hypothetical protein BGZ92_002624 [Podila epicladia]KAG0083818.1 hypothetical protein BGZ93_001592 [Podila epicladia]